jgi:uncharacterized membrane protein YfcA
MDIHISLFDQLVPWQWAILFLSGIIIGISKTGLNGVTAIMIPFTALIFGAKTSTGVLLPLLCFADLLAVIYYRRDAEWKYIIRLLPWAIVGFVLALAVDYFFLGQGSESNRGFKVLMGICIILGVLVMLWNESRNKDAPIPSAWWVAAVFGIMGGFSTMIGNAAGPILSVFLLSVRLPKKFFIGTAAWFFMIINYLKIPLQVFFWHNISSQSLLFDLSLIPFIIIGSIIGIIFVKKASDAFYRKIVFVMTIISASLLFIV